MMIDKLTLKKLLCKGLAYSQIDRFYRKLSENKLVSIYYHGITRKSYNPSIWTQLPETIFIEQMNYLKKKYYLISLSELLFILKNNKPLPKRSALITFDDGLKNNYDVAFPILRKLDIPAVVFLTMDYIGSDHILWFDELFFIVQKANEKQLDLGEIPFVGKVKTAMTDDDLYFSLVSKMKRMKFEEIENIMSDLRTMVKSDVHKFSDDFSMLTWKEVKEMKESGLVEFGPHTASHQILTNLDEKQWEKEISEPKRRLENILNDEVLSFCYPNGIPYVDFNDDHKEFLKMCGFECAFTTSSSLFDIKGDRYAIGRLGAGNDITSEKYYFRLSTSGVLNRKHRIVFNRTLNYHLGQCKS